MSDKTQEKRKYLRFSRKLPIEFTLIDLQEGLLPGVEWQKGFTTNVGKGGICMETENLKESTIRYLNQQNFLLELKINIPLAQKPLKAVGQVAWHQKIVEASGTRYIIGLEFRSIKAEDLTKLFRQTARFKQLIVAAGVVLVLFLLSLLYHFVITKP